MVDKDGNVITMVDKDGKSLKYTAKQRYFESGLTQYRIFLQEAKLKEGIGVLEDNISRNK